jgi:hypothetical protein
MKQTIRPPPRLPFVVGKHEVVRALAATTTCAIDHAVTRGPFGFARNVVLKRVLPQLPPVVAADAAQRLLHEAAALARLAHPAIVRLYEVIEHDGGPVLVLELVDGLSLAKLVDALADSGSALDDACVFYIGHRIASALASAHETEPPVVHGDVAPGNVLVPWDGHVKVVDFDASGREGGTPASDVASACRLVQDLLFRAANIPTGANLTLEAARPDLHPSILDAIDRGLHGSLAASELAATLRSLIDVEAARDRLVAHLSVARERESMPRWCPAPDSANVVSSLAPVAVQPRLSDISTVKTRPETSRVMVAASAAAMLIGILAVAGAIYLRKQMPPRDTAASSPPPPEVSVPSAAASDGEITPPALEGRIVTAPSPSDHRIFVDGKAMGHEGQPIAIRCGKHTVKIGTSGTPRLLDVPCGGEVRATR